MRIFAKILLAILGIPILTLFVLTLSIRYQLLNSDYWINTLKDGGVYEGISNDIESRLAVKTVAGGGSVEDAAVLAAFVSAENVKQFFEKNIVSFLDYANGKSGGITVYIPFSNSTWNLSKEMSLEEFLNEYNIEIVNQSDIKSISNIGKLSLALVLVFMVLTIAVFTFSWMLTEEKKHLGVPGIILSISGVIFLFIYFSGKFAAGIIARDFVGSVNIGKSIAAIIASPVLATYVVIWFWAGILSLISGILLFFVKKPANLKAK